MCELENRLLCGFQFSFENLSWQFWINLLIDLKLKPSNEKKSHQTQRRNITRWKTNLVIFPRIYFWAAKIPKQWFNPKKIDNIVFWWICDEFQKKWTNLSSNENLWRTDWKLLWIYRFDVFKAKQLKLKNNKSEKV